MADINTLESIANLGITQPTAKNPNKELGQSQFLQLLTTTVENQDPLSPSDNTEMITQMAQFSLVGSTQNVETEIKALNENMKSSFALQASSLVGRQVLVAGSQTTLNVGGTVSGMATLDQNATDVMVDIKNAAGVIVHQIPMGSVSKGDININWDGKMPDGTQAPPGAYTISARGTVNGKVVGFPTSVISNVDSVTIGNPALGQQGLTLNVSGVGAVTIDQVKEYK